MCYGKMTLTILLVFFFDIAMALDSDCSGSMCTAPMVAEDTTASLDRTNGENPPVQTKTEQLTVQLYRNHQQEVIQLPSNPTTGYMWEIMPYDSKWLTVHNHYETQCKSKMVGCGGYEYVDITARPEAFVSAPHQVILTMKYHRPWEHGTPPAEQRTIVVTINASSSAKP